MPVQSNFGAELERKRRALENLEPAARRIARDVQEMGRSAIEGARSPDGTAFAPLADSTLARRKAGEGRTRLNKTGQTKRLIRVFARGNRITIQAPAHLIYSQAGKGRMRAEVLPLEHAGGGKVQATKRLDALIRQAVDDHVRGRKR